MKKSITNLNDLLCIVSIMLCAEFLFAFNVSYQSPLRTKVNINSNWMYAEYNANSISELAAFHAWKSIDLPHTWNNEDVTDLIPGYRRNASWYKKELAINAIVEDQKYVLYFEGSNITTQVFVNGKEAGTHVGGYIGFEIDITNFVKAGTNEVLVRVDNSFNPEIIPSQQSDFFIYGGITRDVWLVTKPKTHIALIQINTPKVSQKNASLAIKTILENLETTSNVQLKAEVFNPLGKKVVTKVVSINSQETLITFNNIKNPKLLGHQKP